MSPSTLPAESAAVIAEWLRRQPTIRGRKPAPQATGEEGPVASPAAELGVGELAAEPPKPRKTGLLVASLKKLNAPASPVSPAPAAPPAASLKGSPQNKENRPPTPQPESEHIDPLPEFDLCSFLEQDHCVFVGNRRPSQTADWLPVATKSVVPNPSPAAAIVADLAPHVCPGTDPASPAPTPEPPRASNSIGMDRRAYPRRDSDGVVTVCRRSVGNRLFQRSPNLSWNLHASELKGRLLDVSMTGMALTLSEPLPEGTPVSLQVTSRSLDQPAEVTGRVLRCIALDKRDGDEESGWRLVCQLDDRLTFEQVHSLGKQMFAYTMV